MNVLHRIHARKIVLWYIYQYLFFGKLTENDPALKDVLALDNIFPLEDEYDDQKLVLIDMIKKYSASDAKDELSYHMSTFFDQWKESEIDMDYVFKVWSKVIEIEKELHEKVDSYTTSFKYKQMDTIDQALFLLGYAEWKTLNTPKEVILNELIEIAKRYADAWSTKLINWIMHKILSE